MSDVINCVHCNGVFEHEPGCPTRAFAIEPTHSHRSEEPTERFTRMCDAMLDALHAHPEYTDDVKAMVFLDGGSDGGLVFEGYEDDNAAITDLLLHLGAMMKANGKTMQVLMLE